FDDRPASDAWTASDGAFPWDWLRGTKTVGGSYYRRAHLGHLAHAHCTPDFVSRDRGVGHVASRSRFRSEAPTVTRLFRQRERAGASLGTPFRFLNFVIAEPPVPLSERAVAISLIPA